jgi:hypothetical protein
VLRVSFLGLSEEVVVAERQPEQEMLVTHVRLALQPIALDGLEVRAVAAGRGAGDERLTLTRELLLQLPLEDLHPETLARLAAGVILTEPDSITERMGFSVGGMSEALNQVTLDGLSLGETPVDVPEEGIRSAEVRTSTFDASRGGFAGGQVAMTSARGNNRSTGSLTYRLDNDALQFRATPTSQAFARHNLGGSWGGPAPPGRALLQRQLPVDAQRGSSLRAGSGRPAGGAALGVSAWTPSPGSWACCRISAPSRPRPDGRVPADVP